MMFHLTCQEQSGKTIFQINEGEMDFIMTAFNHDMQLTSIELRLLSQCISMH